MKTPILILKNQNRTACAVTFLIDVNYTNAFCEHLKTNNVKFKRSDDATSEYGYDRDKERWEFVANEIVAEVGNNDFINLLNGWRISPAGQ